MLLISALKLREGRPLGLAEDPVSKSRTTKHKKKTKWAPKRGRPHPIELGFCF